LFCKPLVANLLKDSFKRCQENPNPLSSGDDCLLVRQATRMGPPLPSCT